MLNLKVMWMTGQELIDYVRNDKTLRDFEIRMAYDIASDEAKAEIHDIYVKAIGQYKSPFEG